MGTIRLDDGRAAVFTRAAVSTSGQLRTGRRVDVSLRARAGRFVATDVRFASRPAANPAPAARSSTSRADKQKTVSTRARTPARDKRKRSKPIPSDTVAAVREAASGENPASRAHSPGQREHDELQALTAELTREIRILLVGRTGVGKSTTVNSLLGYEIAPVGHFEPETLTVEIYRAPLGQTTVAVIDTPGLCDDHPDKKKDAAYVEAMAKHASPIDLLFFVTRFDDNRVTQDEIRSLELITARFGGEIWNRAIIVMTHADRIRRADFAVHLTGRTAAVGRRVGKIIPSRASEVPMIPVANGRSTTPDGRRWLTDLWIASAERIRAERFFAYHFATADRIVSKGTRQKKAKRASKLPKDRPSPHAPASGSDSARVDGVQAAEISAIAGQVRKLVEQNAERDVARVGTATAPTSPQRDVDLAADAVVSAESSPPARVMSRTTSAHDGGPELPTATVIDDGVPIHTTAIAEPKPVANNGIVVNRQEARVINNIYQTRANALGEAAKTAVRWVVGKVRKVLFGV